MPGIYGFCGLAQNTARASIRAMSDAMRLYPHFAQDTQFVHHQFAGSRVHLGKIGVSQTPIGDEAGNFVWIEGEVYNLPEVIVALGWKDVCPNNLQFSNWLLYAYAIGKLKDFLNKLDGYFCAALYDTLRQKVLLVSDRYGMRMLYWHHRNGVFAWSSEVKGLLAIQELDRTIDPTSLACFMELGYLLGEQTWLKYVRLIRPATVMEYDIEKGALCQRYYWTWGEIKPSNLSFDDAVDSLYHVFMESVKCRFNTNERIGISLSGGLDSRAIFAAVNTLSPDYEGYAYTFGVPECDDIRIAKEVVSLSKWRHQQFHFTSENWFAPRMEMIWNTDGMLDMMHMHGGEFLEDVAKNIDINLNGYAGDVVAGGGWVGTYKKQTRASDEVLAKYYKSYRHLANLADPYYDIPNAEPALYLHRARRFTNMGTVNSLVWIDQRKPFFDNKVIEWALSIPEVYRGGNHVYSKMLQAHFPKYFRNIPWQKTGRPANKISKTSKLLPVRAANKMIQFLKPTAGDKGRKNYTNYKNWIGQPDIDRQIRDVLSHDSDFYDGLIRCSFMDIGKNRYFPGSSSDAKMILRATTVKVYAKKFDSKMGVNLFGRRLTS